MMIMMRTSMLMTRTGGLMKGPAIADPFVEQPYSMVITTIKEENPLAFTDDELGQFPVTLIHRVLA
jgi:hypothetical protein